MSDQNPNPRNTGQGSSNMVWIIAAVLVVVAAIWYVMRDNDEPVVVNEPAPTESVVVEPTPDPVVEPAPDAVIEPMPETTIEEPADGISVETTPAAPVTN